MTGHGSVTTMLPVLSHDVLLYGSSRQRLAYFMDVTLKSLILGALQEKYPALGIEDADLVDLRARKSR